MVNFELLLSALLHDIGKMTMRGNTYLPRVHKYLKYTKNNGYYHAAFTALFIDNELSSDLPQIESILALSAGHHVMRKSFVKYADFCASGHDRKEYDSLIIHDDEVDDNYITRRMNIIFNEVTFNKTPSNCYNSTLTSFSNYKVVKCIDNVEKKKSKKEYDSLISSFTKRLNSVNYHNNLGILHSYLYPLLYEYTTFIPSESSSSNLPTVSLFDHLKLCSAISLSMLKESESNTFVILDVNLKGIGKRISEKLCLSFDELLQSKQESFFFLILSDFLFYYILHSFNLSYENILFKVASKGRILLPKCEGYLDILKKINNEIDSFLTSCYEDLIFLMSYIEVDENQMKNDSICLLDGYTSIPFVNNLQEVLFSKNQLKNIAKFITSPSSFYCSFNFEHKDISSNESLDTIYIPNIGSIRLQKEIISVDDNSFYQTYNYKDDTKLLGELLYLPVNDFLFETNQEYDKISIDVINMKDILTNGINKSRTSYSKLLTLSRMVDYFFTHELNKIINQSKYKTSVMVVYAGGDDAIIYSKKNQTASLIDEIKNKFFEYTGENVFFKLNIKIGE